MFAFELGRQLGCDYIESDVHLTRDGELVLFHDATLDRMTDGRGPIASKRMAELERLEVGPAFSYDVHAAALDRRGLDARPREALRIPRLETFFDWMQAHPRVRLNVELKTHDAKARSALWRAIERRKLHDRVLVASSHAPTVWAFRRLCRGRVATSAGRAEIFAFWLSVRARTWRWLPLDFDALQIPVQYKGLHVCTPALVAAAHARGVAVHVWTVDDAAQMHALLDMKVDGIMTDRPDLLTRVVGSASGDPE